MRSMRWKGGLVSLLVMGGCGGELSDDGTTGTVVAALTSVPPAVQCVRITIRGATLSFNVAGGASSTSLDLGVQPGGSVQVSAQAYDVACASVTASTSASWVSDPMSVAIASGIATNISLTLRPATRATASVDFFVPAVAIAAGGLSTYALMQDGTMRAWGYNGVGQLGDGTTTDRSSPVPVAGLPSGVRQIAVGGAHACVLAASGAFCWGSNSRGQLGDGTVVARRVTPTLVVDAGGGAAAFTSITVGADHSCGTSTVDGRLLCWGGNDFGQLGDSTTLTHIRPEPVLTSGSTPLYAPAASDGCACALNSSANLMCWGLNTAGRFGGSMIDAAITVPTPVGYRVWASVAIGSGHVCAVEPGGGVYCAGRNDRGQLGDGTTTARSALTPINGLRDATAIAVGEAHSCAIRPDRTVWCWGSGNHGANGSGTSDDVVVPTQVAGLRDVTAITAGLGHTCALLADGSVRCWGSNEHGQLGDGTVRTQAVPVRARL